MSAAFLDRAGQTYSLLAENQDLHLCWEAAMAQHDMVRADQLNAQIDANLAQLRALHLELPTLPAQDLPAELLAASGLGRVTVTRQGVVESAWLFETPRPTAPIYRPTVWCVNPGCHAPYPADFTACPECGTATLGAHSDPGEGRR